MPHEALTTYGIIGVKIGFSKADSVAWEEVRAEKQNAKKKTAK